MAEPGYIHGESEAEQERLLEQARILEPFVFGGVDLEGVERLIEPGVGVGAETRLLRERYPRMHITGVDFSPVQLGRARRVLARDVAEGAVALVQASAEALPFSRDTFDGAFLVWVLEHVPRPAQVLEECARVLRSGGRVWATEVYNQSLRIEPHAPVIDEYFAALGRAQEAAGGHPHIGPHLPELAAQAGLVVDSFRFVPVMGDARDPARAVTLIRYFEGICRSAVPQVLALGLFPDARLAELWAAFDRAATSPRPFHCYTCCQLVARKP